jgi:probable rRNA maturation factor
MVTGSEGSVRGGRGHRVAKQQPAPRALSTLTVRDRQRARRVDMRLLRQIVQAALEVKLVDGNFELAFYLVSAHEISHMNEAFLQHQGVTDVIAFNYSQKIGHASRLSSDRARVAVDGDRREACPTLLHGEIFVCVEEAISQARQFRTTWQSELVRYCVHGLLHLLGYDDRNTRVRRQMKAAEDSLVRELARQFEFRRLSRKT